MPKFIATRAGYSTPDKPAETIWHKPRPSSVAKQAGNTEILHIDAPIWLRLHKLIVRVSLNTRQQRFTRRDEEFTFLLTNLIV